MKAVLIGASVVITLLVVSLGFLIFNEGKESAMQGVGKMGDMNQEITNADYTMYDGMEVSGSHIVNLIRKYANKDIGLYVETKKASKKWYGKKITGNSGSATITGNGNGDIKNAITVTNADYINPNARFLGEIVKDANEVVIGLKFVQQ